MKMTLEQQIAEVNRFANYDEANARKCARIVKLLQEPQVSFKVGKTTRTGGGFYSENWQEGVVKLAEQFPARLKTIPASLQDIQEALTKHGIGKIKWTDMTVVYKFVYARRHSDVFPGADVLIRGSADGHTVEYFYDNSAQAEGAHRYLVLNGKRLLWSDFEYMLPKLLPTESADPKIDDLYTKEEFVEGVVSAAKEKAEDGALSPKGAMRVFIHLKEVGVVVKGQSFESYANQYREFSAEKVSEEYCIPVKDVSRAAARMDSCIGFVDGNFIFNTKQY